MNMQRYFFKYAGLLLLPATLYLSACNVWEKLRPPAASSEEAALNQLSAVLDSAEAGGLSFDYFSARLSGKATLPDNSMRFRASLRMKKDSMVWISVTPAFTPGLEVARLVVTPDSLLLINRMQREYCLENYSALEQLIGVNISFSAFQRLLTGSLPQIQAGYDWELETSEQVYIIREKPYHHSSEAMEKNIRQEFHLEPVNFRLSRLALEQIKPIYRTLVINYSGFEMAEGQAYPQSIDGTVSGNNPLHFQFQYRNVEIDKIITFPVNISPRYQKVDLN